jgi:SAM-dependent methyltransferase
LEGILQCKNCSHVHIFEKAKTIARTQAYGGSPIFDKFRNYFVFKMIYKIAKENNANSIFEIGFGEGWTLSKLKDKGFEIAGADVNQLNVRIVNKLKNDKSILRSSFEEAILPDEKYDIIYGIHLIEHLIDSSLAFKKAYKSLKPNGIAVFITPCANSRSFKIFGKNWWNLEDPTHLRFFSFDSIRIALSKAGFEETTIEMPIWDSLTVEASSFLKIFQRKKNDAILHSFFGKILILFLTPIFFAFRLFNKFYSPSMLIIAKKK